MDLTLVHDIPAEDGRDLRLRSTSLRCEHEEKHLLQDFLDGLTATPWSRLKQRAAELGIDEDLDILIEAVRRGPLHVSGRYRVSSDLCWALVAPDTKGLRSSALMYFVPEEDPQGGCNRIRVDREESFVAKRLGLDASVQSQLLGPARQFVGRGEAQAFCDRVLNPLASLFSERRERVASMDGKMGRTAS